jgi:uncharacterized protein YidB (DUF937 family)
MANPLLGQILGSVFANAMRGRGGGSGRGPFDGAGMGGGLGGGLGGAGLGGILGGMIGGAGLGAGRRGGMGNRGMLLAMLLPFAMQWVQRNGGLGAVLDRFKQKGYHQQADSWVSTGPNQLLEAEAVDNVVGREELARLSRQLGVPEEEVADGLAEILPEMADRLSPEGSVPPEADEALEAGRSELERELSKLTKGAPV